jgi:hypothetical protein
MVIVIDMLQNTIIISFECLLGQYTDGKKDGKGKMCFVSGKAQDGLWSNDRFIG